MGSGNFWEAMNEGFNRGVPLGVHIAEQGREEALLKRREEREIARDKLAKEKHDQDIALGKIQIEGSELDLGEKKAKQRQQNYRRAYIMGKALVDAGDERAGLKIINDATSNLVVNGYGAQIIHKSDNPENPIWKKDFAKDANILVNTPEHGIMGFKDAKSALKIVEGLADPEGFFEYERQQNGKIEERNAAEKPFMGEDGKQYIKKWSITNNATTAKVVPYTEPVAMSGTRQKLKEAEKIKGKPLTQSERNIVLGLSKPEGESEVAANRASANLHNKQAAELGKGGGKKDLEKDTKQRELWAKDLKIVLEPFASKGKPTVDLETGETTQEGQNALKVARALVTKAEEDPNSLTKEEKRNLEHAKRADELHTAISRAIGAHYGEKPTAAPGKVDRGAAKEELKKRGYVEDANGNMVKPSKGAPATQQAEAPGKGEGVKPRDDGRVPGVSQRKWNSMSKEEKEKARKKYRDERKDKAVAGTRG